MTSAQSALASLTQIAKSGRRFRWDEVFTPGRAKTAPDGAQVVGRGYDFTQAVQVSDEIEGATVQGEAQLRVIALSSRPEPTLFLRTRLTWKPSSGGEHKSFACYELTAESAVRLDNTTPEAEDEPIPLLGNLDDIIGMIGKYTFEAMDEAAHYAATWEQTIPGLIDDEIERHGMSEEALAAANIAAKYHSSAIRSTVEGKEPELLCMLSDSVIGQVTPDELPKLLSWVQRRPEIAAVTA